MKRDTWLTLLRQYQAIAILRAPSVDVGIAMANAVVSGGFRLIEVTWNSDRPADLVAALRQRLPPSCCIGVGTVLTIEAAREAIAAGTQFCVSPHTDADLITLCRAQEIPVIPGALTPTEIVRAWQLGANSVKVFPCQTMGGVDYIRHLQGPIAHIPLIPTGGVTLEAASAYLQAGAVAIGISSNLFPKPLVAQANWDEIRQRSRWLLQQLPNVEATPSA